VVVNSGLTELQKNLDLHGTPVEKPCFRGLFHQHFTHSFYRQIPKKTDGLSVFLALLGFVSVKAVRKMLRNPAPAVNFINFICASCSYKRQTRNVNVTRKKLPKRRSFKKFVCKMLMKLTAGKLIMMKCIFLSRERG
jgi:hypothetical protein